MENTTDKAELVAADQREQDAAEPAPRPFFTLSLWHGHHLLHYWSLNENNAELGKSIDALRAFADSGVLPDDTRGKVHDDCMLASAHLPVKIMGVDMARGPDMTIMSIPNGVSRAELMAAIDEMWPPEGAINLGDISDPDMTSAPVKVDDGVRPDPSMNDSHAGMDAQPGDDAGLDRMAPGDAGVVVDDEEKDDDEINAGHA